MRPPRNARALGAAILAAAVGGLFAGCGHAQAQAAGSGAGRAEARAAVASGRLVHVRFHSAAFGTTRAADVLLPPGYAAGVKRGRRFPVLYFLHGSPGWPRLVLQRGALGSALDRLERRGAIGPVILVMPDGRDGTYGSDTEWANTPHGPYGRLVLETVAVVDRRFATIADRGARAIAGNSEGGFAAVNIGLHHLDRFSVIESWSGYFTALRSAKVFRGASAAKLRANSPATNVGTMAAQIRADPVRVLLYGGARDSDTATIAPFAAALRRAGADVTTRVVPGGHSWSVWRGQTPFSLRYLGANLPALRKSS
jgi:enterochelin esterase-like enzyme